MTCAAANVDFNTVDFEDAARNFHWSSDKLEPGVAVALSGGGYRAMLFHAGALLRMNELGLLSRAQRISSVSGGSIAAGCLARIWTSLGPPDAAGAFGGFKKIYVEKLLEFSKHNIDVMDAVLGHLPFQHVADRVAGSYDKYLFGGASLQSLPDTPRFVFCATNLQTGVLWRFSKPYAGDYVVGCLERPDIALSIAVAASSAFPPFLSPLSLDVPPAAFKDWPTSNAKTFDAAPFRAKILLVDGGVYDNHGLEPIVKRYTTLFVSDGGAPFKREPDVRTDWLSQLRRVLDLEDNQSRALRRRDLIARLQSGNDAFAQGNRKATDANDVARMGAYWGIDTNTTSMNAPGALACDRAIVDELAAISTRLSDPGDARAKQLINWGYAVCDRSVRCHYHGPEVAQSPPAWPYPDAALG